MIEESALLFTVAEYADRLARVRTAMAARGLDLFISHIPENVFYLTGYRTPSHYSYQAVVVPLEQPPFVVTRHFEESTVLSQSWIQDCVAYRGTEDGAMLAARTLRDRGLARGRIGLEEDALFLPVRAYRALESGVPDARIVDAERLVEAIRAVKSPAEIGYIRRAARAAEAGVRAALAAVAPGRTENDVAAAMYGAMLSAGSEYAGAPGFVAAGPRSAVGHATWERRRIDVGDTVFIEAGGCVARYAGANFRAISVGPPPDRVRVAAEVACEAVSAAIDRMRPGVTGDEVDAACRAPIRRAGLLDAFRHPAAYSLGVNFAPGWGEGHIMAARPGETRPLQANTAFHVVTLLCLDGLAGVGVSETVLVTEAGPEILTHLPRQLFVT
jgi:Xaa-Pro dipeptidase